MADERRCISFGSAPGISVRIRHMLVFRIYRLRGYCKNYVPYRDNSAYSRGTPLPYSRYRNGDYGMNNIFEIMFQKILAGSPLRMLA